MPLGLILVGLALPLIELAVLIKLGQSIGLWMTLLVLVGSGLLGGAIVRAQGTSVMLKTMDAMREGRPPVGPMLDGMMLMLAGVLFIIPGLVTDAAGALLLVPPLRRWLADRMLGNVVVTSSARAEPEDAAGWPHGREGRHDGQRPIDTGQVIEGEWKRVDDPNERR